MMSIMRGIVGFFIIVLAGCSTTVTDPALNSTLWIQTSAEYDAVALQTYAAAGEALDAALKDPQWSAALEQTGDYGMLEPAVILDIDETVLDNSGFQGQLIRDQAHFTPESWEEWVTMAAAHEIPGAAAFIRKAEEKKIAVIYITNRKCGPRPGNTDECPQEANTIRNLKAIGVPDAISTDLVLLSGEKPEWTSEKKSRRDAVTQQYRILLMIGDDLGDFIPDVKRNISPEKRAKLIEDHKARWGSKWFMLPNPVYGSWQSILEKPQIQYIKGYR